MAYRKPDISAEEAKNVIERHFGDEIGRLTAISGGNLSRVYSFQYQDKGYVVRFSDMDGAFATESYVSQLLSAQGVPFPRMIGTGETGPLTYAISERVEGVVLADLPNDQRIGLFPELIQLVTRMNQVQLGPGGGFGWISPEGTGSHRTWEEYLVSFYREDQTGNFWENWYELFHTTFLEKDVFDECYNRLMEYAKFNAPHRYFVHNDCHAWNILSDGSKLTGIIDGNCVYGDFAIDIIILEGIVPERNTVQACREHYERSGLPLPDFEERLLGARYYKGLDGLRFYAKMGWKPNYEQLRDFLLGLVK